MSVIFVTVQHLENSDIRQHYRLEATEYGDYEVTMLQNGELYGHYNPKEHGNKFDNYINSICREPAFEIVDWRECI